MSLGSAPRNLIHQTFSIYNWSSACITLLSKHGATSYQAAKQFVAADNLLTPHQNQFKKFH
jgi:hypothetical protein